MLTNNEHISKKIGIVNKEEFKECIATNQFYAPLFVKIKPTGKCNLKCKKCNYWKRESHITHPGLSLEKIIHLVDELSGMGCKCIKLSGGEITLLKDLPTIVKYIKLKGITCSITSNGTLIDEKLARSLILAGLDKITISIDSHNPKAHDYIVGTKGAWGKSVNGVKSLVKQKKIFNSNLKITIATVLNKLNYKGINKLLDLLYKLKVKRLDLLVLVTGHLEDKTLSMDKEDIDLFYKKITPKIIKKSEKLGIYIVNLDPFRKEIGKNSENIPKNIYERIPCYVGWYSFLVHFNGIVALCCANKEFEIGDINENKLSDIINNKRSCLFRKIQKTSNKPYNCFQCFDEIENNIKIFQWLGGR